MPMRRQGRFVALWAAGSLLFVSTTMGLGVIHGEAATSVDGSTTPSTVCHPPVPCVSNSVTYQGRVDEFLIFSGAVATVETAAAGTYGLPVDSPVGASDASIDSSPSGDACQVYSCNTGTRSYWFDAGPWQGNVGTGSYNWAWFSPVNPPNDGNAYGMSASFNYVQAASSDYGICGIGTGHHITADSGTWSAQNYQPTGSKDNNTGQSQAFTVSAGYGGMGVAYSATQENGYVMAGGYDANNDTYSVVDYVDPESSCDVGGLSNTSSVAWVFNNFTSGYIHFSFDSEYSATD